MHVMGIVAGDHRFRDVRTPIFAFVIEGAFRLPDSHHDLERFYHHDAILAVLAVDVERQEITDMAAGCNAELQSPLRQVIEKRDSVRQFDGIVIRQQVRAGRELDALRLEQGLSDGQVRRGVRLPGDREMFTDPCFLDAELVAPSKRLQVGLVPVVWLPLRRMCRHHEIA